VRGLQQRVDDGARVPDQQDDLEALTEHGLRVTGT
jgi:hypothetical protein